MNANEAEVQIGVRVPVSLKRKLEQIATEEDRTLTQVVRQAIRDWLSRREKKVA